jgi:hypothetical protein
MKARPIMGACSICGQQYSGHGKDAWPVNDGRCCDRCNMEHVALARIALAEQAARLGGGDGGPHS